MARVASAAHYVTSGRNAGGNRSSKGRSMKKIALPSLLLIAILASDAKAENNAIISGTTLYEVCFEKRTEINNVVCNGFLYGLVNGLRYGQRIAQAGKPICFPQDMQIVQTRLILEKFMKENADKLHGDAADIATGALFISFPCERP
jgi:hypothetical protein